MQNLKWLGQLVKKCAILLMLPLAACSLTTNSKGTKLKAEPAQVSFCAAGAPIRWSRLDTVKTIAQVKEHNAVGVALHCSKWVIP